MISQRKLNLYISYYHWGVVSLSMFEGAFIYLFVNNPVFFKCNVYWFLRERERERECVRRGGAERERETKNPKQAPGSELSPQPDAGLKHMDHEIMTWAEVRRSTDWATQAPLSVHNLNHFSLGLLVCFTSISKSYLYIRELAFADDMSYNPPSTAITNFSFIFCICI